MCEYTGRHFGAAYEDACCIDGHLWDLDSDDGAGLTSGGDTPCPRCNTAAYLDNARDDAESTVWGENNGHRYCGAMLIEGGLRTAEFENMEAAIQWKEKNKVVKTFDWADRIAVLQFRSSPEETIEVEINLQQ